MFRVVCVCLRTSHQNPRFQGFVAQLPPDRTIELLIWSTGRLISCLLGTRGPGHSQAAYGAVARTVANSGEPLNVSGTQGKAGTWGRETSSSGSQVREASPGSQTLGARADEFHWCPLCLQMCLSFCSLLLGHHSNSLLEFLKEKPAVSIPHLLSQAFWSHASPYQGFCSLLILVS